MKLKHATVMALATTSVTLTADILSWIPQLGYFEVTSWLLVLKHIVWMGSLIAFFAVLLKNQVAAERKSHGTV